VKRKHQRLVFVLIGLALLGSAAGLVLYAVSDTLVFFYSPSDLQTKQVPEGRAFRLGGLVEAGSMTKDSDGVTILFRVTDGVHVIPVAYRGILPDLFREGQGVVAQGMLDGNGVFVASEVLAKHDENYMPREVVDALKASGHWHEGQNSP
jgi:cytochrome c-type biogenesis protein CcmE